MKKKRKLSNEEFVTAWQQATSLASAASASALSTKQASDRAHYLRRAGVPLKVFQEPGQRVDREGLKALAERLGGKL